MHVLQSFFKDRTNYRGNEVSRLTWERLKERYDQAMAPGGKGISAVVRDCSRAGISQHCLISPSCLLWDLRGFDITRQLIIDEFHNIAEGMANFLYGIFLDSLSDKGRKAVEAAWKDPNTWDPLLRKWACILLGNAAC